MKSTETGRKGRQPRFLSAFSIFFMRRRKRVCLLPLFLLLLLSGCAQMNGTDAETAQRIYYLNADRSLLAGQEYVPSEGLDQETMGIQDYISDVIWQLSSQTEDLDTSPPVQGFTVDGISLTGSAVTLDLSGEYYELDSVEEVLVRAAIVNSLCQIEGVDSVSFLCGGSELINEDGETVGAMTSDLFIINSGSEILSYEKVRLHLYFASENGDQLVDTYRTVVYNSNISQERLVVEQVLMGPNSDVVYPTLNSDARILSVTTRDGICYVNFDAAFLEDPYNVTSQVAIYSLVNSLTELTSVQKVQILIDGDGSRSFMDTSLANAFVRNFSIVKGYSDTE